jgi:hypothetical protein
VKLLYPAFAGHSRQSSEFALLAENGQIKTCSSQIPTLNVGSYGVTDLFGVLP